MVDKPSGAAPDNATRILAVTIGGLGDAILFSPVFKALRNKYPAAELHLLVASSLAAEVYRQSPILQHISQSDTNRPTILGKGLALVPFSIRSRAQGGFDVGVFATGLNPRFISLLSCMARIRFVATAPSPGPLRPTDLACNVAVAQRFDPSISENDAFVPLLPDRKADVLKQLADYGIEPGKHRILAVYPSRPSPRRSLWPLPQLLSVADRLKKSGLMDKVVAVGSVEEGKEIAVDDTRSVIDANLAGRIPVTHLSAFFSACALTLGNDGGLLHVAGAVGCPVVDIPGGTLPSYRPPGKKTQVLQGGASLSMEDVYEACRKAVTGN